MAKVIPFRGIYYDMARVRADDVSAPPYDIITPEMREILYSRSPYNVVRIDSGKDLEGDSDNDNKYTRAINYLNDWFREGILARSLMPCFYAYEMDYATEGQRKTLNGFFGLVRLTELGSGIYPHECTHSKPKLDRLTLLRVCKANTSPIFSLYRSPEKGASSILKRVRHNAPLMEARDMWGAMHRLWVIEDPLSVETIKADLSDKAIYIADGHHRYETALEYMKSQEGVKGNEPFNYVLMFLANTEDDGLTILPTHRLVNVRGDVLERLSAYFLINELPADASLTTSIVGLEHTIGLCLKGGKYTLSYKGKDLEDIHPVLRGLDVVVLHELVLKMVLGVSDVAYEMDGQKASSLVEDGTYTAAFFLRPTAVRDVEAVAVSSMRMPPKSTYFYPKLLTGFVMNSLRE